MTPTKQQAQAALDRIQTACEGYIAEYKSGGGDEDFWSKITLWVCVLS